MYMKREWFIRLVDELDDKIKAIRDAANHAERLKLAEDIEMTTSTLLLGLNGTEAIQNDKISD